MLVFNYEKGRYKETSKYLYHLTDTPDLTELKPCLGKHSQAAGEIHPNLFLCGKKDVPYWQCLLGCKYLIRIDACAVDFDVAEVFEYSYYSEIVYDGTIPCSAFRYIKVPAVPDKVMSDLAESYMESMSLFCRSMAYYDKSRDDMIVDEEESLRRDVLGIGRSIQISADRIDFSVLSAAKKKSILVRDGQEGECTLADTWNNGEKRLWEMLTEYENVPEDLADMCGWVQDMIVKKLPKSARYADTGGWT